MTRQCRGQLDTAKSRCRSTPENAGMGIAHHLLFSCDILFNNSLTGITQPTYHLKLPLGNHMQKIQEVAICMAGHLSALAVEDRHFTLIVNYLKRKEPRVA